MSNMDGNPFNTYYDYGPLRAQPTSSSKCGGCGLRSHLVRLVLRVVLIVLLVIGIVLGLIGCFVRVNELTAVYSETVSDSSNSVVSVTVSFDNIHEAYFTSALNNLLSEPQDCVVIMSNSTYTTVNQSSCTDINIPQTIEYAKPGAGLLIAGPALAFIAICLTLLELVLGTLPGFSTITAVIRIICFIVVALCMALQFMGVVFMCVGCVMISPDAIMVRFLFTDGSSSDLKMARQDEKLRLAAGPPLVIVSVILFAFAAAAAGMLMC